MPVHIFQLHRPQGDATFQQRHGHAEEMREWTGGHIGIEAAFVGGNPVHQLGTVGGHILSCQFPVFQVQQSIVHAGHTTGAMGHRIRESALIQAAVCHEDANPGGISAETRLLLIHVAQGLDDGAKLLGIVGRDCLGTLQILRAHNAIFQNHLSGVNSAKNTTGPGDSFIMMHRRMQQRGNDGFQIILPEIIPGIFGIVLNRVM